MCIIKYRGGELRLAGQHSLSRFLATESSRLLIIRIIWVTVLHHLCKLRNQFPTFYRAPNLLHPQLLYFLFRWLHLPLWLLGRCFCWVVQHLFCFFELFSFIFFCSVVCGIYISIYFLLYCIIHFFFIFFSAVSNFSYFASLYQLSSSSLSLHIIIFFNYFSITSNSFRQLTLLSSIWFSFVFFNRLLPLIQLLQHCFVFWRFSFALLSLFIIAVFRYHLHLWLATRTRFRTELFHVLFSFLFSLRSARFLLPRWDRCTGIANGSQGKKVSE